MNSAAAEDEVIFVPSESVHVIDSEHADPGLKTGEKYCSYFSSVTIALCPLCGSAIATAVPVKEVSEHDRLFYLARTSCFREIMGMPLWTEDPHK